MTLLWIAILVVAAGNVGLWLHLIRLENRVDDLTPLRHSHAAPRWPPSSGWEGLVDEDTDADPAARNRGDVLD